ncbi:Putative Ig domain-containing protein [Devosia sp. YR412]|uniref:Ig-like domain repeat protein n=1 Tax=Devosia sp. YR412 TaxID=1881030 RepID=UPI0008C3931E|nr:Ig-like domain repeat protein [Devosia sp. YR412]SEP65238.1 Putative Ig domain-containing protein [Devosia sp. YR412]
MSSLTFGRRGSRDSTDSVDSGEKPSAAEHAIAQSGLQLIWRCTLSVLLALLMVLLLASMAMAASLGCTAVNNGQLNYSGPSAPIQTKTILLTNFTSGDHLTYKHVTDRARAGTTLILSAGPLYLTQTTTTALTHTMSGTVGSVLGIELLNLAATAQSNDAAAGVLIPGLLGDPTNIVVTVTCIPAPAVTTMTLTSNSPTVFGQAASFSAGITAPDGSIATGNVTFTVDGVAQPPVALNGAGVATLNMAGLSVGSHTVSAAYAGNGSFTASSATLSGGHTVNKAATTTAVTSSTASAVFGSNVTFTATVAVTAPGTGTPPGSVIFTLDGVDQSPVALNGSGVATITTNSLGVGSKPILARYVTTTNYAASNGSLSGNQTVTKAPTSTAVTQSAPTTIYGQSVTFTATVTSGVGTPTGNVVFTIDGVAQAPTALNGAGVATLSSTSLPVGNHTISADYTGTANLATSSGSLGGGHAVTAIVTTTTLSGPGSVVFGTNPTITATVSSASGTPTGSVVFTVDGTPRAPVALNGGSVDVTLTGIGAGTHTVTADYAGTAIYAASSGTLSGGQVVTKAATTTTISPVAAVALGQSLSLTATVASASGTPGGTVTFTVDSVAQSPVTLSGGQANLLVPGLGVGSHTISAAYSGADNYAVSTSAATTGTVNKAASSVVVSSSANPAVAGQAIALTATVSASAASPTGTVVFTIDTVDQPAVSLSSGVATLNLPGLAVGSHTITASYSGDANLLTSSASLPGGQTVARAATTTALSSDAPSPALGAAVTFTAVVAPVAPGAGSPTGNVIFSIDNVDQPGVALNGAGTASITRSNLGVGSHVITARYAGDTNFAQSNGTLSGGQTVVAASTATVVTFTPSAPTFGSSATVSATVTSSGGTPAGNVIFTVNSVDRAPTSLVNGVADLVLSNLAVGSYTLGARFVATSNYLASTATDKTMVVGAAPTTTTVSASPSSIKLGESTTLSASVSAAQGTPSGSVEFRDGTTLLGTVALNNGAASLSTTALSRGDHTITANYLGTTNYLASSGTLAGVLPVLVADTNLTLSAAPAPSRYGQDVTLTATATALPAAGTPQGNVVFTVDGVARPASAMTNGVATLTLSALEPGIHSASVSYAGSTDHGAASASIAGGIVVTKADATLSVGTSPASPVFGNSLTVTATLGGPSGPPTGDVTFVIDGVTKPAVTPTAGVASIVVSGLEAGSHTVEARFAGDAHFNAINVTAPNVTFAAAPSAMTLAASPSTAQFGDSVTLTATLSSPAGPPTGSVVFSIDGVAQAPSTITAGVATLSTSGLTIGPHVITANYAAQGNFGASSATLSGGVEIDVATTQTAVAGPAGAITVGDTAQFTATITAAHGTPNGTVVFAIDGVNQPAATLSGGVATFSKQFTTAGTHTVTATYNGAANFAPSSGTLSPSLVVNKATSQLVISAPSTSAFGTALVVTATAGSTGGTPGGTVIFYVDNVQVGSGILSGGVATLTLPQPAAGSHTVTAAYAGDLNFGPSVATGVVISVTPAATVTTITAAQATVASGEPVSLSVTVKTTPGNVPATGNVTVTLVGDSPASTANHVVALSNGAGTLVLNGLAANTYTVTATYAAGGNFDGSSATLATALTVEPPPSDIHVTANLPRSVSGTAFSGSFTAFGGVPFAGPAAPYNYAVTAGVLPPGLTLDANTGTLTGTAGAAGTYNFTITATGQAGAPGVLPVQIRVLPPTTITLPSTLNNGVFGVDFAQSVAATGGTAPMLYVVSMGALPQGVVLDSATGALTGAPTQLGNAGFIITATDANDFTASQSYAVSVVAPTITVTGTFPNGTVGATYPTTTPSVSGGATPRSFSFDGSLPPGLSVNATSGALSGTPSQDGTFNFGIIATDANGFSGRLDTSMTVVAAPVIVLPTTLAVPRQNRPYSQNVTASGGTPAYAYEVASGALPPGLSLNPTTGRISGTPTSAGPYTFEIKATDSTTLSGTRSYTLNVQAAAVLVVDADIGPITAWQPFDQSITVTGGTSPYSFTIVSGTLPTGITLDPATGQVSGTAPTPGAHNLILDIADAAGDTVTVPLNLQVLAPTIAVTASINNHNFGQAATGTISATGGTAPYTYAVTSGALPNGVAISAGGAVSGTATTAGTFNIVLTATDAKNFTGTAPVAFTITPPTLTLSALPLEYMLTRPVTETVIAGGGTAPYTLALTGNLPAGLSFNAATGALTGTPTALGARSFTITATDDFGFTVARTYNVETVTNIGTATLPGSLPAATADVAYTGTLTATGGATPLSYAITSGTLPAGLTMNASGVITGKTLATGNFPITLTVTGSDTRTNTASYVLTVNPPTIAANGTLASGTAGVAYNATVPVSGGKSPYGVVLKSGSLPAGLGISAAGVISGTPTEDGTFNIVLTVTDANGFAADIPYTLAVAAPSITLAGSVPAGRIGQAYNGQITVTGGVTPYGFTVTTGTLPAGLSLNPTTGAITGTPTAAGTSTVTITATDDNDFTGLRSYEFVIASNMGTTTLPASLATPVYKAPYTASVAASGGNAPYGYAVTTGALPAGLSLNPTTGAITGTPTAAGNFNFTVTVTDNQGLINQQSYQWTIAPPVITISGTPPAGRVSVAYPATTITASGGATPYGYVLQNAPPGLVIGASSGVISGTPTQVGTYSFNVVVTDNEGFTGARSFSVVIGAAPIALNLPASLPQGVTATPYSVSLAPDNAVGAVTYSLTGGTSLPLGLSLNTSTGVISGLPTLPGTTTVSVRAQDADGNVGTATYGLTVSLTPPLFVPTSINLSASSTSVVVGEPLTVTARVVTATGNANNGIVTLQDDLSGAILGIDVVAADGTANFNLSFQTVGNRKLSAHYAVSLGFAASDVVGDTITVTPAATQVTLSGTSGTVPLLGTVVLVANVSRVVPASGAAGAGNIIFSVDGTDTLTVPAILGSGTFITTLLPPGEHRIRARFVSTSGADLDSFAEEIITVTSPTLTLLTAPLGDILFGASPTFTATVVPVQLGVPVSGNVVFRDNGSVVATVPVDGNRQAVHTLVTPAVGLHLVTAEYVGDAYYSGSTALSLSLNVLAAPTIQQATTTTVTASSLTPQIGEALTISAAITAPGIIIPTGLVTFRNDTTNMTLGTALPGLDGVARITLALTDGNPVDIVADYAGDLLTLPSSGSVTVDPVNAATAVALSASSLNVLPGETVTLTAQVTRPSGGQPEAGTIAFLADGVAFDHVPTNGAATVSTTSAPLSGPTSFTAQFIPGTGSSDAGSLSAAVVVNAAKATPSLSFSAAMTPDGRAAVTVTVVPPTGVTVVPTGSVVLQSAGKPDQTVSLTAGAASFTYPVGSFAGPTSFIANYSGDAQFNTASDSTSVIASTVSTQTVLSLSDASVVINRPVTATVTVTAAFPVDDGMAEVRANGTLVGTVPVVAGTANIALTNLQPGSNTITASYLGSVNYAPSSAAPATVTVLLAPVGDLSVSLTADAQALFSIGQTVNLRLSVGANQAAATNIAVNSTLAFNCPRANLGAGETMSCSGAYLVTAADLARGRVDFAATVTADGMTPAQAQLSLRSAVDEIAKTFEDLSNAFVADRSRVISNAIPLPNILQRRANISGTRAGNVLATSTGSSQTLAFTSSLQDWHNYAAAQAASDLALAMDDEPLPFNIWIDAQYALHASTEGDGRWGSVGTVALGADYLLSDNIMAGVMIQGDWATQTELRGTVSGQGFLAGPYVSVALGENLSFDATVLYGRSSNTASSTQFGETFSGNFDTTRLNAKAALSGYFELDALTIRPNATFSLASETIDNYVVSNARGDMINVPGGNQLRYQLTVGAMFEYEMLLDNGARLTPSVGFDVGVNGGTVNGAEASQTMLARVNAGVEYETEQGLIIGLEIGGEIDSGGFSSAEIRASIKGRF